MEAGLIHSIKLSSIGPANVTSPDAVFEPENMDLAMKLHYLRGVYYFGKGAFAGLTVFSVKEPLFSWLDQFPVTCGRFRRGESGRAYLKCNDCGVRLIQAKCDKTLDEWLMEMKDDLHESLLCANHVVGPELQFSPLVYLQLTDFKCGGVAVGLSWAHVLGDAFSAAKYLKMLGRVISGSKPERPINPAQILNKPTNLDGVSKSGSDPISVKRVDPVGENWAYATPCKMESFSFHVTAANLSHIRSILAKEGGDFPHFEALAAVIWRCVARIRGEPSAAEVVNIFRKGEEVTGDGKLGNYQIVSSVKADFEVAVANLADLARLVKNEAADDRRNIEEVMEREGGLSDFIVYGANLSFVDLEEAAFYDFECKGQRPVRVVYRADGVGEKGAVLVLPGGIDGGEESEGRLVTVVLPENEIAGVKLELKREGLMA